MRTNKEVKDITQEEDTVQFLKSLQLSMVMLKECQNKLQQLNAKYKGKRNTT